MRELERKDNLPWRTVRKAVDSVWPECGIGSRHGPPLGPVQAGGSTGRGRKHRQTHTTRALDPMRVPGQCRPAVRRRITNSTPAPAAITAAADPAIRPASLPPPVSASPVPAAGEDADVEGTGDVEAGGAAAGEVGVAVAVGDAEGAGPAVGVPDGWEAAGTHGVSGEMGRSVSRSSTRLPAVTETFHW